jgi:undecaprenyl diphosphate synthase
MVELIPEKLPRHVAVIMDGNGRWAKKKTMNRIRGHEEGAESVREIVRTSREIGISWLTLYAFSEENWKRPRYEIGALMKLLKRFLESELGEMLENGIRLQTIGRTFKLPKDIQEVLSETMNRTASNKDMVLTLALSYGGRQEITDALQKMAAEIASGRLSAKDVTDDLVGDFLYTAGMPDPDLLIRTSGECRVSNFLLWQIAYTEIYTTPTLWPDFRREEYMKALAEYQLRERRFGATGEQVANGESGPLT